MIRVVCDTSVVAAAIFWPRSSARRALALIARRQLRACVTSAIEDEYRRTCLELQQTRFPDRSPTPFLDWIHHKALHCIPAPLAEPVSRDATDDPFLACALSADPKFVVTSDKDLLSLRKPFGITIVTPMGLIKRVAPD